MTRYRLLAWFLALVALTAPPDARAGDCETHPVTLIELDVLSCERLEVSNARRVVPFESLMKGWGVSKDYLDNQVAQVVAERAAILVEARTRRTRTINIDSRVTIMVEPVPENWEPEIRSRWLVLRTKDADACTRLTPQKPAILAHPTDCSCDTGPSGWCAVDEESIVSEVPAHLRKFAR